MALYDLISVTTEDSLKLSGLYLKGDIKKAAVVLIHGFTSDFYSHAFYHAIGKTISALGHAYILAQTRGTGLHTEFFKTDGSSVYIGSYAEKIEDAHRDITAFVKFLQSEGYTDIVLAGHSLGTIKVVRYLFEGTCRAAISKLILLAPFDKNAFMERKAGKKWDEYLHMAQEKINAGNGLETVPVPEFEDFPMTYQTFVSWYNKSDSSCIWDFYRAGYINPLLSRISIPVQIILGGRDEYVQYPEFQETAETAISYLKMRIQNCTTELLPNANHTFVGYENTVAQIVSMTIR